MAECGVWPFFVVDAHVYYSNLYGDYLLREMGWGNRRPLLLMLFGNFENRFSYLKWLGQSPL